jgi:hypothetical protein
MRVTIIFDANGALLGRIPSTNLRSKILDFYIGAKGMVDSLQYYAHLNTYYFALGSGHPNLQICRPRSYCQPPPNLILDRLHARLT